jgi:hypothetical protein
MFNLQSASAKREIYYHEDDYCQQELLPREALAFAESELKKSDEFAAAHLAPGGIGWTDVYVCQDPQTTFRALKMTREDFDAAISSHLPPFDQVYTGYSEYRERCKKAAAWGTSQQNAIFIDWDDEGVINSVWTQFFDSDEKSISAASKAIAALGMLHSLIYVDWAWSFVCEIFSEDAFASRLRSKLSDISGRTNKVKGPGDTSSP